MASLKESIDEMKIARRDGEVLRPGSEGATSGGALGANGALAAAAV